MVQWARIELDRDSDVALYQQLAAHIEGLILSKALAPGEKLPPSRELATELGLNRATVTSAFDELSKRGRVRSHVGQGTFVTESRSRAPLAPHRFRLSRAVEAASERVRPSVGLATDHRDPIDFASLVPDEELFPITPFRHVLDEVLKKQGKVLLQYGPAAGHPELRRHIAERLEKRGVRATAENVLIVNGSQQALDLICRTLLDPGDRVALESPTYTIVLPLLAQYQARVESVPMTEHGMDLLALERVLERSRPKLIFTMPTFHNPTGITTDLNARKRLLEIAARFGTPVIEDDFDSDLRFEGDALPPLKALDVHDAVLHIGTFSKGLFPGLRLGWIVAPAPVVETLATSKLISDYHTSLLLQAAVLEFCRKGHYERHLGRLAAIYRRKSRTLVKALERSLPPDSRFTKPEGGYAFWVTLPDGVSSEALLTESAKAGVLFTPGSFFFPRGEGERFLRLSISRVPERRIEEGVRRLAAVLTRLIGLAKGTDSQSSRALGNEPALHI